MNTDRRYTLIEMMTLIEIQVGRGQGAVGSRQWAVGKEKLIPKAMEINDQPKMSGGHLDCYCHAITYAKPLMTN